MQKVYNFYASCKSLHQILCGSKIVISCNVITYEQTTPKIHMPSLSKLCYTFPYSSRSLNPLNGEKFLETHCGGQLALAGWACHINIYISSLEISWLANWDFSVKIAKIVTMYHQARFTVISYPVREITAASTNLAIQAPTRQDCNNS